MSTPPKSPGLKPASPNLAALDSMQGWLRKRPKYTGVWGNYYFILTGPNEGMLYAFSNDPKRSSGRSMPVHAFHLARDIIVSAPVEKTVRTSRTSSTKREKVFAITVTTPKLSKETILFTVGASTMQEAEKWKKWFEDTAMNSKTSRPVKYRIRGGKGEGEADDDGESEGGEGNPEALALSPKHAIGKPGTDVSNSSKSPGGVAGQGGDDRHRSAFPDLWAGKNWHVVETTTEGLEIEAETSPNEKFPMLRAKTVVNCPPEEVFHLIMDDARRTLWDSGVQSTLVLREISPNTHVVYLQTRPFWIGPLYTGARDLVLLRYWRKDGDQNNYVLTFQSIEDSSTPHKEGFVRGKIFSMGFSINHLAGEPNKSTVRVSCHADPGGNLSFMPMGVLQKWLYPFVTRILGLKQLVDSKFTKIEQGVGEGEEDDDEGSRSASTAAGSTGSGSTSLISPASQSSAAAAAAAGAEEEVNELKIGTWNHNEWMQTPPTAPFNIRGKTYLTDSIKYKTSKQKFHLVAADLNRVDEPIHHCAARSDSPLGRISKAYPDRQILVMNLIMPGPPFYLLSFYSVAKPGVLDDDSPFANLWASFREGNDEYRNSCFKMIPRVPHGAYVVRKTVGEVPALLGRKVKLNYYVGPNYVEIDCDLNTSAVAGSILSIFKGYATTLTCDLGLLLEGHSEDELPEEMMVSLRMVHPSLAKAKPLGPDPNPAETQKLRDLVEKVGMGELLKQDSERD